MAAYAWPAPPAELMMRSETTVVRGSPSADATVAAAYAPFFGRGALARALHGHAALQALASRAVLAALAIPPTDPALAVTPAGPKCRLWRGRAPQASLLTWKRLAPACSTLSGGATEPLRLP